jgi:hypothetical protein
MDIETPKNKRARARNNRLLEAIEEIDAEEAQEEALLAATEMPEPVSSIQRPALREDPRTRAARRAAELREHRWAMDEGTDEFRIALDLIPDGWDYEWKRKLLLGQEDPAYQVQLARNGWEAVPADRHPEMMPSTGNFAVIERKGMILMERPKEITEEVRSADLRRARQQVRQKEEQLNSAPEGTLQRKKSDGSTLTKINKSYEAIPIPD